MLNHYTRALLKHSADHRPVCLAREGWVFFQLLNHLSKANLIELPHAPCYLKVSRTLLFRSLLGEEESWEIALKHNFKGSVLNLLMKRFGLQLHEAFALLPAELLGFNLSLPEDLEKVIDWLAPHSQKLHDHVTPTREALQQYLKQEGLFDKTPTPLMLDLGYAGTIQKLLTKMTGRDTAGLYFIANASGDTPIGKASAHMRGVFRENVKWSEGYIMLDRSLLLESLMTAPHGQVVDIRRRTDGTLDFFYGRMAAPQRYYQDLETVLQGAIAGVEEGLRLDIQYSVEEIEAIYSSFATPPSAIPKSVWHLFNIDDDFSGNGVINPTQLFGL